MQRSVTPFPADDDRFRRAVAAAFERAATPDELEAQLRADYPAIVVHASATDFRGSERWYAYRDGRWGASRE